MRRDHLSGLGMHRIRIYTAQSGTQLIELAKDGLL
jgi:hypothetical protein